PQRKTFSARQIQTPAQSLFGPFSRPPLPSPSHSRFLCSGSFASLLESLQTDSCYKSLQTHPLRKLVIMPCPIMKDGMAETMTVMTMMMTI
ncbi:hypothetical protein HDU76_011303, partial [Blyttiomyces sp. JEL0837]